MNFLIQIQQHQKHINQLLEDILPEPFSFPLYNAMHYCVCNGGKRLRPLLVYLTGETLGLSREVLDPIACAIEIIHCYSLVHDDLPAMDNADLRRGQPSCHKKYDEATAILAGDALLTLAFAIIADAEHLSSNTKVTALQQLARASGATGMIRGQALDLAATQHTLPLNELIELYHLKTGQLLHSAICIPALIKNIPPADLQHLTRFADCLGLGYQIQDDLLDIEGETEHLGKQAGIDKENRKNTFPMIAGLDTARQKLIELQEAALASLQALPFNTSTLRALTNYIFKRDH